MDALIVENNILDVAINVICYGQKRLRNAKQGNHLNGCFWVSLSFPTGGQKLTTSLSLITVRADY